MSVLPLYDVLLAPVVTEKSTLQSANSTYVFKVRKAATKSQIKEAVERFFEVKVQQVFTQVVKGKATVFRQRAGKQATWKKAYVKLHEGQEIDFGISE